MTSVMQGKAAKGVVIAFLIVALFFGGSTSARAATSLADMQSQITVLLNLLRDLEAELAALQKKPVTSLAIEVTKVKGSVAYYEMDIPAKYAGHYVDLIMNPEKVSTPVSGGSVSTWRISPSWKGGVWTDEISVDSAHEGFASNQGGVHWFMVPKGTYSFNAVIYATNPYKPGSDMEYYSAAEQLRKGIGASEIAESNTFRISSFSPTAEKKIESCTIKVSPTNPKAGEDFKVSWTTKNIDNPIFVEGLKAGGEYSVRKSGSLTFNEGSAYEAYFAIKTSFTESDDLCFIYPVITEAVTLPSVTLTSPNSGTYSIDDPIKITWDAEDVPQEAEFHIQFEGQGSNNRQISARKTISRDERSVYGALDSIVSGYPALVPGSYKIRISVIGVKDGEGDSDLSNGTIRIVD